MGCVSLAHLFSCLKRLFTRAQCDIFRSFHVKIPTYQLQFIKNEPLRIERYKPKIGKTSMVQIKVQNKLKKILVQSKWTEIQ